MKNLLLTVFVFILSHAAFADNYISCSGETETYTYQISGSLNTRWSLVASDDLRADGTLAAVRTEKTNGAKPKVAVRNYSAEFHKHAERQNMWVILSKKHTIYAEIKMSLAGVKDFQTVLSPENQPDVKLNCNFN